jgi:penicillin-binding protein 1A
MRRLPRAAVVVAALSLLASACALPHPHLQGPVPKIPPLPQTSMLFDDQGHLIRVLHAGENRVLIPLSQVPPLVRQAVVAIEDARFYSHHGVDLKAVARAAIADARAGRPVQGGSTITEQLVKITITGSDRTLSRKFKDAVLAYELEGRYTKAQILELYLNTVYFGEGAYGVQAAAQTYFSRPASELTLTQGALLAGLIQSPSGYDPVFHAGAALSRRNQVLARMEQLQMIASATERQAAAEPVGLKVSDNTDKYPAPYFVDYVERWFLSNPAFGATYDDRYHLLFEGGLRISTTIDMRLQEMAERAVHEILIAKSDPYAAMTVLDPRNGNLVAMVGGRGYFSKDPYAKLNLATGGSTGRQAGSTFKAFTLVTALQRGISPQQVFAAPPSIQIPVPHGPPWPVSNFEGSSYGSMTLEQATVNSVNTVYAQVVMRVGPANVAATAARMGIASHLEVVPSITLGTSDVNTVEMASAFGTLADEGYHAPVTAVTKITDAAGKVIYQADQKPKLVVQPAVAYQADQILQEVVQQGTGVQAAIDRPTAGKTGTTQDYADAWFVGFIPQMVAAVWVGYPKGRVSMVEPRTRIPAVLGGTWPAEIWHAFMTNATRGMPVQDFQPPGSRFVTVVVDVTQGCLPNAYTPPQDIQPVQYALGTEPTEVCTEPSSPQPNEVPQVTGLTEDVARATLESYGFQVLVEAQPVDGFPADIVLSQSPASGSPAYPGDTVIIVVAQAPGTAAPSP